MFMAKQNVLTKAQFSLVGTFGRYFDRNSRLTLQHNVGMVTCIVFFAAFYFHLTNICGFTSTVPCMRGEMTEALMRYN